jgi:hypothetical protein
MKEDAFYKFCKACRKQLWKNKIRQFFSPCRRCKLPVNKCTYCPYRKEIKDERTRIAVEKL